MNEKKFPIQIVDDSIGCRWITLKKCIKKDEYSAIYAFHKNSRFIIPYILTNLLKGKINTSHIYKTDVIRNPNLEEFLSLSSSLRQANIKINLKKNIIIFNEDGKIMSL